MWDYKVVAGSYTVDGSNVYVKSPAGEGLLQQLLDHYGGERWELASSTLDSLNREVVLIFKKPRGGVAAAAPHAAAVPAPAAPAGSRFVDADGEVVRRRSPAASSEAPAAGGRRSKRDLDALAD